MRTKHNPLHDRISADAKAQEVDGKKVEQIGHLVAESMALAEVISAMSEELKGLTDRYQRIIEVDLPDLMDEAWIEGVSVAGGIKISVKTDFHAGALKSEEGLAWIEDHDLGDVIKSEFRQAFGKGKEEVKRAKKLRAMLAKSGIPFEESRQVHPQTLRALVREQTELGVDVPLDLLGVHVRRIATIKS